MKDTIEKENLLFGVSIYHIMNKYEEFNTLSKQKLKSIANKLNNFYIWLNKQDNITSQIITLVAEDILDNFHLREAFLDNSCSTKQFQDNLIYTLSNINIDSYNKKMKNKKLYSIEYNDNYYRKIDGLEFMKIKIYSNKLLYSDIIMLLINNYEFFKKTQNMSISNFTIKFINVLNLICFKLDNLFSKDRQKLYYAIKSLLAYKPVKKILYDYHSNNYSIDNDVNTLLCSIILDGLHNINKFYYIEILTLNYINSKKNIHFRNKEQLNNFLNFFSILLNYEQYLFIIKLAKYDSKHSYLSDEIEGIENFIQFIQQNNNVIINSQKLDDKKKKLINDSFNFSKKYCETNKLNVIDCNLLNGEVKANLTTYIEININYNNFIYKFVLYKNNKNIMWRVNLKNNKIYKINMYLEDDFKHIVQAMINDEN